MPNEGRKISLTTNGYILCFDPRKEHPARFTITQQEPYLLTTARPRRSYSSLITNHHVPRGAVVAEAGPGLGGYLPALAKTHDVSLIAIDPLDYASAAWLMEEAILRAAEEDREELRGMLADCTAIRDGQNIDWWQMTLQEAADTHPASIDILIDHFGPLTHGDRVLGTSSLNSIEHARKLIKPKGTYLAYGGKDLELELTV